MAIQAVSLIILWFLAFSAAQNTCGEVQCKLLPVKRDIAIIFQELASEKGVRLVYFYLEIDNDSFNTLESKEGSFSKEWVWAKTIREPMLFLPEDYDIYSLGLLKYQVRYLTVHLEEQPNGCLAGLNTSCQDNALGKTLLGNVTKVTKKSSGNHFHQKDFVCTTHVSNSSGSLSLSISLDRELNYLCCSVQNFTEMNDPIIRCGIHVESGWFLASLNAVFMILVIILFLYCPLIPLLLPDFVFNLQHEYENEEKKEQQIRNKQKSTIEKKGESEEDPDKEDNQEENDIALANMGLEEETDQENNQVLLSQPNEQENEIKQLVESEEDREEDDSYGLEFNFPVRDDHEASDCELIPLDDASPITVCDLLGNFAKELPHLKINFNLKLLFLCFVVFPTFLHLKLAVIMFHKFRFYQQTCQKLPMDDFKKVESSGSSVCSLMGFYSWRAKETVLNIMLLTGCVNLFVLLLFIRPKDLFYQPKSMCDDSRSVSISHDILQRLNVQREWVYDFTFFILKQYMNALKGCLKKLTPNLNLLSRESRQRRAFRFLCVSLSALPGLLVVAASAIIFMMVFLITLGFKILWFSPLVTCFIILMKKIEQICFYSKNVRALSAVFAATSFIMMYILVITVLDISVTFIIQTFLFTIMGVILNAEFVTPYVAFILVVTRNMYLCYSNLQSRYKEVKGLISKHWKDDTKNLPWINCTSNDTIPKDLFWIVCGSNKRREFFWCARVDNEFDSQEHIVLPIRTEMFFMLRDMALILLFLFLSLFTILSFKSTKEISALVSTIFVFISGAIPSLILGGFAKKETFISGWNKIRIEKKIKKAVKDYVAKMELRHSERL